MAKEPVQNNNEAMIIAWALIIIMICLTGSLSTGMGPIEFFFIAIAGIFLASLALFLIGGFIAVFIFAVMKNRTDDNRPLLTAFLEEYGLSRIAFEYGQLFRHLREYGEEIIDNLRRHYGKSKKPDGNSSDSE